MASNVLVADDDDLTLEILATILDLEEFDVTTCHNGIEAVEKARAGGPWTVFLLDVMMPGKTGLEVCRELRALPQTARVPIVLLTARGQEDDRAAGLDAGADAYLTKPFSPLSLIDTIRSLGL